MTSLDLSLYAIVDPERSFGHDLPALARAVVEGGATIVQLRDKLSPTRAIVARARAIMAAMQGLGAPFLVNDRVDVALAVGADGVHLGQDDMAIADARRLLGADALIGLSIKTREQALAAPLDLLDYVAIGGVFATTSKDNPDPPVGLDGLGAISAVIRSRRPGYPICAIAGIDESNAAGVIAAGADGVAVISCLSGAANPASAASDLRAVVARARSRL